MQDEYVDKWLRIGEVIENGLIGPSGIDGCEYPLHPPPSLLHKTGRSAGAIAKHHAFAGTFDS
jgi:hypothetical protein